MFVKQVFYKVIFLVFMFKLSHGQLNMDSVKTILDKTPNDTASLNGILNYGIKIRKVNLDISVIYFKWVVDQSKQIDNKYFLSKALCNLGSTYSIMNDFGSAAENLIQGLRLAEELNDKGLILKAYIGLGNMYSYSQQTFLAKGMYLKGLKIAEELNKDFERATILNNLGALTYRESNLNPKKMQVAVSYFLNAVNIIEKSGNSDELIYKYNNLGLIYCDLEKQDSALFYLAKSKKIMDSDNNPDNLITYYNYLGRVYASKKDFSKAEEAFLISLDESRKLNDPDWIYEAYLSLAGLYESKGDFKNAFEYYRKYSMLKDTVVNESNFAVASDIKNKFEREKKEVELNKLKAEQSRNKIFNIALILVSILTIISGIMMYSRFKIKSVSEAKLKIQNDIITQKNKDITDSINYARKIQQSVLPQEKYIERELKKLKG